MPHQIQHEAGEVDRRDPLDQPLAELGMRAAGAARRVHKHTPAMTTTSARGRQAEPRKPARGLPVEADIQDRTTDGGCRKKMLRKNPQQCQGDDSPGKVARRAVTAAYSAGPDKDCCKPYSNGGSIKDQNDARGAMQDGDPRRRWAGESGPGSGTPGRFFVLLHAHSVIPPLLPSTTFVRCAHLLTSRHEPRMEILPPGSGGCALHGRRGAGFRRPRARNGRRGEDNGTG